MFDDFVVVDDDKEINKVFKSQIVENNINKNMSFFNPNNNYFNNYQSMPPNPNYNINNNNNNFNKEFSTK